MNIVKRILTKILPEKRSVSYDPTTAVGLPYGFASSPLSLQLAMQLSVVYRCVEVISDAIASQSWEILEYDMAEGFVDNPFHQSAYMLNLEPNPAMSRYILMKTLVAKILLEGNGYIRIIRDNRGDPVRLDLITAPVTMFMRDNGSIYYEISGVGYNDIYYQPGRPSKIIQVEGYDMIHVLNFTYDGLIGVSTLRHAANTLGISYASEQTAKSFFTSGANSSGILTVEGKLTEEKAIAIKEKWKDALDVSTGNPGGIVVIEKGLDFKPVTIPPKDAQLVESREFNAIDICRFFGVSPSKVFDSKNLTYSNIESFQLGFLTDTISPLDSKIENEFNRKLFRPSLRMKTRLNLSIKELLRADLDAKANYVSKMFQCGGYNVNEVRKECGNPKHDHENANKPMVQINMQPVDVLGVKQKPIDKKVKINEEE